LILLPASAVLTVVVAVVDHHTVPVVRALWTVALSGLTVGLSAAPLRSLVNPVTQRLGQASFSLYLIHPGRRDPGPGRGHYRLYVIFGAPQPLVV
jgi:peptidoglycan/LPS O-acetylase OafA/YrhL